ncbi:MAG: lactonase family protein, partial [Planctomycetes bacterium]|nr:lactonase family protein [Planctomycetota bacterium]
MEKQDRSFVYIATAGGAAISSFQLDQTSGRLEPLATTSAAGPVIALAVRPDRRCLYASVKGTPPAVVTYGIDSGTGQLEYLSSAPVAESLNYLVPAAGGRFLLG